MHPSANRTEVVQGHELTTVRNGSSPVCKAHLLRTERRRRVYEQRTWLTRGPGRNSFTGEADGMHRGRKGSISLYGRMKKAQKSALAIFKSTFE